MLEARPLTREAFAAFGDAIIPGDQSRRVNDGRAMRHDGVARLAHDVRAVEPVFALYAVSASLKPFAIDLLERHPLASQIFVPMRVAEPYLVVVAPSGSDGEPAVDRAEAFAAPPDVGVHYASGVWHMPMAAFGADALFAMWMWEAGGGRDTEERRLPVALRVEGW
ncbi:ureidoglycolate lyase [Methylopila capsulata]|uniref:Ureidoglycolate lyase n=2 Tax=Methylopila capsulata TaxID=61654 RepID=A0ABS2TE32_9HYPH|nr:ureidoglycolate lyase [Methylopila capsulata]MBM7853087.1 ureidoglycolate lyase [Methylopila capsulata]